MNDTPSGRRDRLWPADRGAREFGSKPIDGVTALADQVTSLSPLLAEREGSASLDPEVGVSSKNDSAACRG